MAYFDNAATTYPKPDRVYSFMDEFYRKCGGNVGRGDYGICLLYTSPSPRDPKTSRMPSSA